MLEAIKDWTEEVIRDGQAPIDPKWSYHTKYHWPARMKSLECASETCAFIKCLDNDDRCPNPPNRADA